MRWIFFSIWLASPLFAMPGEEPLRAAAAPKAWLGVEVSKPEESIHAQVPELPKGIGFIVRLIDPQGPAVAAGIESLDIIWKLDDQLLVNEGQLAALLRLREPGDPIKLAGFRAGLPIEFKLKLGAVPASMAAHSDEKIIEASLLNHASAGPMRVINLREKVATYSDVEGNAEVMNRNGIYQVKISTPSNVVLYRGSLPPDGNTDNVPLNWRRKIDALRRGLDHAMENGTNSPPRPRPRVLPPSK